MHLFNANSYTLLSVYLCTFTFIVSAHIYFLFFPSYLLGTSLPPSHLQLAETYQSDNRPFFVFFFLKMQKAFKMTTTTMMIITFKRQRKRKWKKDWGRICRNSFLRQRRCNFSRYNALKTVQVTWGLDKSVVAIRLGKEKRKTSFNGPFPASTSFTHFVMTELILMRVVFIFVLVDTMLEKEYHFFFLDMPYNWSLYHRSHSQGNRVVYCCLIVLWSVPVALPFLSQAYKI